MDNLVKYVKENKNKNFKDYPFNEIDAAIYSVLPYINFMGIINDSITIKEAYEKTKSRFLLKYQDKLDLTPKQQVRWHKKCLCLVEFTDVEAIKPLDFDHQGNMDDWLILDRIEDVVVGTSIPYNYNNARFK